jgi:uncharacterized membrane protein YebE (DUF533 family)
MAPNTNTNTNSYVGSAVATIGGVAASALLAHGGYNLVENPNIENVMQTTLGYCGLKTFLFADKCCGDYATTADKVTLIVSGVGLLSCIAYRNFKST